jgi:hypothetical protein
VKGIIGWVKKNLIVVISVVLILVFLPVGWVFSSGWNKSIKDKATTAYNQEKTALTKAGSVSYGLPGVLQGEESLSESRPPNTSVTSFYQTEKQKRLDQVKEVVARGTDFNKRNHTELVPGLLPAPQSDFLRRQLGIEMAEMIAGTRDSAGNQIRPSIYDTMLRRLNAGMPPGPDEVGATLAEYKSTLEQRFTGSSTDGRLTEAQTAEIAKSMVTRRLGEYAGKANSLAFYASPEAIRGSENQTEAGWSSILRTVPASTLINEADAFVWLWDYWVVSDVLDAVALANSNPQTGSMTVPSAPVKRVDRLRISEVKLPAAASGSEEDLSGGFGGGADTADAGVAGPATHTGRAGGTADSPYDLRTVELTVVASSKDLPRLIDALGRINNMTVVDVDLQPVDVWAELAQGFFYGADHVVRATLTIETVWLRSWTSPLMPDRVRTAFGLPALSTGADEAEASDEFSEEEEP